MLLALRKLVRLLADIDAEVVPGLSAVPIDLDSSPSADFQATRANLETVRWAVCKLRKVEPELLPDSLRARQGGSVRVRRRRGGQGGR